MGSWFKGIQPIKVGKARQCGPVVGGTTFTETELESRLPAMLPMTSLLLQEAHREKHKVNTESSPERDEHHYREHWDNRKCALRERPVPIMSSRL